MSLQALEGFSQPRHCTCPHFVLFSRHVVLALVRGRQTFHLIQYGRFWGLKSPLDYSQRITIDLLTMIAHWQYMLICSLVMILSFPWPLFPFRFSAFRETIPSFFEYLLSSSFGITLVLVTLYLAILQCPLLPCSQDIRASTRPSFWHDCGGAWLCVVSRAKLLEISFPWSW